MNALAAEVEGGITAQRTGRVLAFRGDDNSIEKQGEMHLVRWHQHNRDSANLGLPRQAATEHANMGGVMTGSLAKVEWPADVLLTERAVAQLNMRSDSLLRRFIRLKIERNVPMEGVAREMRMKMHEAKSLGDRTYRYISRARKAVAAGY